MRNSPGEIAGSGHAAASGPAGATEACGSLAAPLPQQRSAETICRRRARCRLAAFSVVACCSWWLYCLSSITAFCDSRVTAAHIGVRSLSSVHSEAVESDGRHDEAAHLEAEAPVAYETAVNHAPVADGAAAAGIAADALTYTSNEATETSTHEACPEEVQAADKVFNAASKVVTAARSDTEEPSDQSTREAAVARRLQSDDYGLRSREAGSDANEGRFGNTAGDTEHGYGEVQKALELFSSDNKDESLLQHKASVSAGELQYAAQRGEQQRQQQQHEPKQETENITSDSTEALSWPLKPTHQALEEHKHEEQGEKGEDVDREDGTKRGTSLTRGAPPHSEIVTGAEHEAQQGEHGQQAKVAPRDPKDEFEFLLQQLQQHRRFLQQLKAQAGLGVAGKGDADSVDNFSQEASADSNIPAPEVVYSHPVSVSTNKRDSSFNLRLTTPLATGLSFRRGQEKPEDTEEEVLPHLHTEKFTEYTVFPQHSLGSTGLKYTGDHASELSAAFEANERPTAFYGTHRDETESSSHRGMKSNSSGLLGSASGGAVRTVIPAPQTTPQYLFQKKKKPVLSSFRHKWETRALPKLKPLGEKMISFAHQILDRVVLMPQVYPFVALQGNSQQQQRVQPQMPSADFERMPADNEQLYKAFLTGAEAAFTAAAALRASNRGETSATSGEHAKADAGTPDAASAAAPPATHEAAIRAGTGDTATGITTAAAGAEEEHDADTLEQKAGTDGRLLSECESCHDAAEADAASPSSFSSAVDEAASLQTSEHTFIDDGEQPRPPAVVLSNTSEQQEHYASSREVQQVPAGKSHLSLAEVPQIPPSGSAAAPAPTGRFKKRYARQSQQEEVICGSDGKTAKGEPCFGVPHFIPPGIDEETHLRQLELIDGFLSQTFGGGSGFSINDLGGLRYDTVEEQSANQPRLGLPGGSEPGATSNGNAAASETEVLPLQNEKETVKDEVSTETVKPVSGGFQRRLSIQVEPENNLSGGVGLSIQEDEEKVQPKEGRLLMDDADEEINSRSGVLVNHLNEQEHLMVSLDVGTIPHPTSKETQEAGATRNSNSSLNSIHGEGDLRRDSEFSSRLGRTSTRMMVRIPGSRDPRGRPLHDTCTRCEKVVLCLLLFPGVHTLESCSLMYLPEGIDNPFNVFNTKCSPCSSWGTTRPLPSVLTQSTYTPLLLPSSFPASHVFENAIAAAGAELGATGAIAVSQAAADGAVESNMVENTFNKITGTSTELASELPETLSLPHAKIGRADVAALSDITADTTPRSSPEEYRGAVPTTVGVEEQVPAEGVAEAGEPVADAVATTSEEASVEPRAAHVVGGLSLDDSGAEPRRLTEAECVAEANDREGNELATGGEDETVETEAAAEQAEPEEDNGNEEETKILREKYATDSLQQRGIVSERQRERQGTRQQSLTADKLHQEHAPAALDDHELDRQYLIQRDVEQHPPPVEATVQQQQQHQPQKSEEKQQPHQPEEEPYRSTDKKSATAETTGTFGEDHGPFERAVQATALQDCSCGRSPLSQLRRLGVDTGALAVSAAGPALEAVPAAGTGETPGVSQTEPRSQTSAVAREEGTPAVEVGGEEPCAEARQCENTSRPCPVKTRIASSMHLHDNFCDCCQLKGQRKEEADGLDDSSDSACSTTRSKTTSRSSTLGSSNSALNHVPLVLQHIRDHPWMTRAIVGLAILLGGDVSPLVELDRRKNDMTISGLAPAFVVPPPQPRRAESAFITTQQQRHHHAQQKQQHRKHKEEERPAYSESEKDKKDKETEQSGINDVEATRGGGGQELSPLLQDADGKAERRPGSGGQPATESSKAHAHKHSQQGRLNLQRVRFLQAQMHPVMAIFWEAMAGLLLAADEEQIEELRRSRGAVEHEELLRNAAGGATTVHSAFCIHRKEEETKPPATVVTASEQGTKSQDTGDITASAKTAATAVEKGETHTSSPELTKAACDSTGGCCCRCTRRSIPRPTALGRRFLYAVKSRNPAAVFADTQMQQSLKNRVARDHTIMASFWETIAAILKGVDVKNVKELRRTRAAL